ncbi:MAG TPA: hypothetical protein ENF18_04475 [candidate division WOR-3 bacterium]|uniref:Uncharacterized protein n=1 Tax=candidate division WOR-3 bacterium TaxID=2052148 RepID=A0A7C0VBR3_UNCW3|nr:hypothetical protein [candidate division WOR-3 bacterium]
MKIKDCVFKNLEVIVRYVLLFFSISLYGTIAYIGHYGDVYIYDVTDPDSVYEIASFDATNGAYPRFVQDIWFYKDYLYIALTRDPSTISLWSGGVTIFDASDSINPVFVSEIYTGGDVRNIYLQGDLLYVVSSDTRIWDPDTVYQGSLFVYNISDPSNLQLLDAVEPPGNPMDVYVNGEYVYVGTGDSLLIYTFPPIGVEKDDSLDVYITGEYVVVKGYRGGIRVYDVVGRDMKVEYSFTGDRYRVYTGDLSSGVYFLNAGGRVYRFLKVGGIKDLSRISSLSTKEYELVRVGGIDTDGYWTVGTGSYVFCAPDSANNLRSIDVSDPLKPVKRGFVPEEAGDMIIVDTLIYVLTDQIDVISISEPWNPVKIDTVGEKGKVAFNKGMGRWLVYKEGKVYYTYVGELRICDVTDPVTPVEIYNSGDIDASKIEVK